MALKWDCAECGHKWKDKDENQYEECLSCQSKYIEKVERYEKALEHIATRKMSTYLSTSHMNQDFIKTALEALKK